MRQLHRKGIVITSVDGSPDIAAALKDPDSSVAASASQDPYAMGQIGVHLGADLLAGKKPANPLMELAPKLVTRDNVGSYKGWTDH